MVEHPIEMQLELDGSTDVKREKKELARRMLTELEQHRSRWPAKLVFVYEREEVDPETGEVTRQQVVREPVKKTNEVSQAIRAAKGRSGKHGLTQRKAA
jgi:hypothetical protein